MKGNIPNSKNKIIPGIKKLLKGEWIKKDKCMFSSSPEGKSIKASPPARAEVPRSTRIRRSIFLSLNVLFIL